MGPRLSKRSGFWMGKPTGISNQTGSVRRNRMFYRESVIISSPLLQSTGFVLYWTYFLHLIFARKAICHQRMDGQNQAINATRDSHGSERVSCHEFQGSVYGVTLGYITINHPNHYIQKLFAACFLPNNNCTVGCCCLE